MTSRIGKLGMLIVLAAILLLGGTLLASSYSEVGVTWEIETEGLPSTIGDLLPVPKSVVDDAAELATELYGESQKKCDYFISQLLTVYSEARNKDFVMVFNSGGWGWNSLEDSPGWWSIFDGINSELTSSGYSSLLLNHVRTAKNLPGRFDEFIEMGTGYRTKARDLAYKMEFIINHIPDLRVIIAGESTGTVICDSAMNILKDNPQVYSLQSGPPFWHKNIMLDRTLVMTDNGIIPDSYSQGNFWAIIGGNLKYWLGLSQPEDNFGTTPHYVRTSGHDYWWQYPGVHSQITNFLDKNFGIKWP